MTNDEENVGCPDKYFLYENGVVKERSVAHFGEPSGRCHDCNAPHGTIHHAGCDVERCPICDLQLIGCAHHQPVQAISPREVQFMLSLWNVFGQYGMKVKEV
jgi:hypothetical protein